jgi:hypothetical protein
MTKICQNINCKNIFESERLDKKYCKFQCMRSTAMRKYIHKKTLLANKK